MIFVSVAPLFSMSGANPLKMSPFLDRPTGPPDLGMISAMFGVYWAFVNVLFVTDYERPNVTRPWGGA